MAKRKAPEINRGSPEYMLTYGDMTTLLLCFFVFLITMSTIDVQKFKIMMSAFQGGVGFLDYGRTISDAPLLDMGMNIEELSERQPTFKSQAEQTEEAMSNAMQQGMARIREDERGLIIDVHEAAIFPGGTAEFLPGSSEVLNKVAYVLREVVPDRSVRIEGHTDGSPIETDEFPSNWELSMRRSVAVLRHLEEEQNINTDRLSAVGYGSTRPVATNETEEGRRQNRRIEIVILRDIQKTGN